MEIKFDKDWLIMKPNVIGIVLSISGPEEETRFNIIQGKSLCSCGWTEVTLVVEYTNFASIAKSTSGLGDACLISIFSEGVSFNQR